MPWCLVVVQFEKTGRFQPVFTTIILNGHTLHCGCTAGTCIKDHPKEKEGANIMHPKSLHIPWCLAYDHKSTQCSQGYAQPQSLYMPEMRALG